MITQSGVNTLQLLKSRTEDLHRSIETVVPLTSSELTVSSYSDYLEDLFPFYREVEARLRALAPLRNIVKDLDARWKLDSLTQDLRGLGRVVPASTERVPFPDLENTDQALGCLYVLEGSTLGGAILVRMVRERLGASIGENTRFLASYGAGIAERWRRLGVAIEGAIGSEARQEAAVQAARATFASLENWLRRRHSMRELVLR